MKIDVLTLFPDIFNSFKEFSIVGRAIDNSVFALNTINIRDFSENKHKKVDDYPFGGGPGMLMTPQPIYDSIKSVKEDKSKVIYMTPTGRKLNQEIAKSYSKEDHLIILCGHYEGIDNRIVENYVDDQISIGDYVLTGGELAAMVFIETVIRLLPGTLSSRESFVDESHFKGLLEHPQYTRPREFKGHSVPEVLLSGNHAKIEEWKLYESLKLTYKNRPDLLKNYKLNKKEKEYLNMIKKDLKS